MERRSPPGRGPAGGATRSYRSRPGSGVPSQPPALLVPFGGAVTEATEAPGSLPPFQGQERHLWYNVVKRYERLLALTRIFHLFVLSTGDPQIDIVQSILMPDRHRRDHTS